MVFLRLLSADTIKRAVIQSYNLLNNAELNIHPSVMMNVASVVENRSLIIDQNTNVGIVFRRISLAEIIDPEIDITAFKDTTQFNMQLPGLNPAEVEEYNGKVGDRVLSPYENNFSNLSDYDLETLKKYATFCRVAGFFDLDISEVNISVDEGKMTIQVVDRHPMFSGMVEVKTW